MPDFQVMLAASEIPDINAIEFPIYVSYKYDGIRTFAIDGNAYSRKMELIPNLFVQGWFFKNMEWLEGLDGELIVGPPNKEDTFRTTSSGVMSQDGYPDFKFYVFEYFNAEKPWKSAKARYEDLGVKLANMPLQILARIELVKQYYVSIPSSLKEHNDNALANGYEGLILKKINGQYKQGRSTLKEGTLLKWKEFADSEIQIESVKQGKTNTNEKTRDNLGNAKRSTHKAGKVDTETIGAFIGKDINPKSPFYGKTITVGPGSYKKSELEELWKKHCEWCKGPGKMEDSPVVGKIMVYKYQVAGTYEKPRYPGAKGFRNKIDM